MKGRRLPVIDGKVTYPEQPGDYCGPVMGYTGDKPAVFFLKPNARDSNANKLARRIQYVISPPHTFHEEADGSLTIRNSIGDTSGPNGESDGWHGHLIQGIWSKV